MMAGSGSRSLLTNRSWCGSRRPKNKRILRIRMRIRIPNTASGSPKHPPFCIFKSPNRIPLLISFLSRGDQLWYCTNVSNCLDWNNVENKDDLKVTVPLVRGMDPRIQIRIHIKMSWIRNTDFKLVYWDLWAVLGIRDILFGTDPGANPDLRIRTSD